MDRENTKVDSQKLTLNEYANKYKVSISTLRRRIKNGSLAAVYEDGKYYLQDGGPLKKVLLDPSVVRSSAPPQQDKQLDVSASEGKKEVVTESRLENVTENLNAPMADGMFAETIQLMLEDLKAAYKRILEEKEEQILILKEEIADLKTLVGVLENENERLQIKSNEGAPIDNWLEGGGFLEKG
jgi:hypothetical protein